MKLDDLIAELEKTTTTCTALVRVSPQTRVAQNGRQERSHLVVVNGEIEVVQREQEMLPVDVILVEDESTGCMQYMRRDPDGRLGAIEDC